MQDNQYLQVELLLAELLVELVLILVSRGGCSGPDQLLLLLGSRTLCLQRAQDGLYARNGRCWRHDDHLVGGILRSQHAQVVDVVVQRGPFQT